MSKLYLPDATLPQLVEFVRFESGPSSHRLGGPEMWLSLPHDQGFPLYPTIRATPMLADFIKGNSIYGDERDLSRSHYIEVCFRDDGTALVLMKYQQILGSRWLCIVPQSQVIEWVRSNVVERDYEVSYETRTRGAIGIFECRTFKVRAIDETSARDAAREEANKQGYETRNPIVTRWKE
jgi:hypothetical protein